MSADCWKWLNRKSHNLMKNLAQMFQNSCCTSLCSWTNKQYLIICLVLNFILVQIWHKLHYYVYQRRMCENTVVWHDGQTSVFLIAYDVKDWLWLILNNWSQTNRICIKGVSAHLQFYGWIKKIYFQTLMMKVALSSTLRFCQSALVFSNSVQLPNTSNSSNFVHETDEKLCFLK